MPSSWHEWLPKELSGRAKPCWRRLVALQDPCLPPLLACSLLLIPAHCPSLWELLRTFASGCYIVAHPQYFKPCRIRRPDTVLKKPHCNKFFPAVLSLLGPSPPLIFHMFHSIYLHLSFVPLACRLSEDGGPVYFLLQTHCLEQCLCATTCLLVNVGVFEWSSWMLVDELKTQSVPG